MKVLRSVILMGTVLWLATVTDVTMAMAAHMTLLLVIVAQPVMTCINPVVAVGQGRSWDHETTTATFTLYSSNTLDATINSPSDFGSKLCLSCHDGTVAIDSYGGVAGTDFMTGPSMLGTDLSNDHPVSFTYNTALANLDGGLKDPATENSGLGGTIQEDLLVSDMLECNSCHNIHREPLIKYELRHAGEYQHPVSYCFD